MTATSIMLASGALFDLLHPEDSDFTLSDIAQGMARTCRFAGHSSRFYSVAEHCVHVASLVPVEMIRPAMLHDASEAFIGDVTRPLKALLPDYRAIEKGIEDEIERRFLTPAEIANGGLHADCVKAADIAMCITEAQRLMPNAAGYWDDFFDQGEASLINAAFNRRINCHLPDRAASQWLSEWHSFSHITYWESLTT